MRHIEFVSYDGKYPNYCSGNLIIKVNGVEYSIRRLIFPNRPAQFDEDYNLIGDNSLHWGTEFEFFRCDKPIVFTEEEQEYIYRLVNDCIPCRHCGGCS